VARTGLERSLTFPPDPSSPAAARRLLGTIVEDCGRPDWRDAAELALTELITNALLHAHTEMTVRISCDDKLLRVEVEDSSPVVPVPRGYGPESSTGRGLGLVAAITHEHGITRTDTGKIVWFALNALSDETDETDETDIDVLLDAWRDDDLPSAPGPTPPGRSVTLVGFPPTLWLAAAEMHDALLRELALFRTGRDLDTSDLAAADQARFAVRSALAAALARQGTRAQARSPLPPGHPARLPDVPPVLDLEIPVGTEAAKHFAALQDVLDEANRLAADGQLLMHPALPEVIAVRDWAAEQVISALSGQAPMPWPGADAEHFAQRLDHAVREFDFDVSAVVNGDRTAIVVDGQNRILGISAALAAEVGWEVDDLVGRRVVALVPPPFREAHVAGLTRHLSTGEAHALRVDLQLPVLCADGTEVLCDSWIDADRGRNGQPVYIAYISPARTMAKDT